MDLSGLAGFACFSVLGGAFAGLFALCTLIAGMLGRPVKLVGALAALSLCMNFGLLWYLGFADSWPWEPAISITACAVTMLGLLLSWMRTRSA